MVQIAGLSHLGPATVKRGATWILGSKGLCGEANGLRQSRATWRSAWMGRGTFVYIVHGCTVHVPERQVLASKDGSRDEGQLLGERVAATSFSHTCALQDCGPRKSPRLELQIVLVTSSPMYDSVRRYFGILRRYHQPSQFVRADIARDVSRLAHGRYIRRENEAVFTAVDSDLLRRVGDRDAHGAGEEYTVPVGFVRM